MKNIYIFFFIRSVSATHVYAHIPRQTCIDQEKNGRTTETKTKTKNNGNGSQAYNVKLVKLKLSQFEKLKMCVCVCVVFFILSSEFWCMTRNCDERRRCTVDGNEMIDAHILCLVRHLLGAGHTWILGWSQWDYALCSDWKRIISYLVSESWALVDLFWTS